MGTTPTPPGIITTPSPIPQPNTEDYGLAQLNLYPSYSRAQLTAAGFLPPNCDPTQPTKLWSATVDPSGNPITAATPTVTFGYWKTEGNTEPVWTEFTMTGAQALAFNCTGINTYPSYYIPPTNATQGGDVGNANSIDPGFLSTMAQALALAESWGMTPQLAQDAVSDYYNSAFYPWNIQYNGETRQYLGISWNNQNINVGQMLQLMYANGVGAPGSWIISGPKYEANDSQPLWVSAQPEQAPDPQAAGPIPMRKLNAPANEWPGWAGATRESFSVGLMGVSVINGNVRPPR